MSMNPGWRVADPAPLGLSGFAVTTFLLSGANAGRCTRAASGPKDVRWGGGRRWCRILLLASGPATFSPTIGLFVAGWIPDLTWLGPAAFYGGELVVIAPPCWMSPFPGRSDGPLASLWL